LVSAAHEKDGLVLALPRAGEWGCFGQGCQPLLKQNLVLIKELQLADPSLVLAHDEHASIALARPQRNGAHVEAIGEQRLYRRPTPYEKLLILPRNSVQGRSGAGLQLF
jgi:hypothetical protein